MFSHSWVLLSDVLTLDITLPAAGRANGKMLDTNMNFKKAVCVFGLTNSIFRTWHTMHRLGHLST
jgi:hypothetical protein